MNGLAAHDVSPVKLLPAAVRAARFGNLRNQTLIHSAAVRNRNFGNGLAVRNKGYRKGQEICRDTGQCTEGGKIHTVALARVADAVHACQIFVKVIIARNRSRGCTRNRAQLFPVAVHTSHGTTVCDVLTLSGDAAQVVAALQIGLRCTVFNTAARLTRNTAGFTARLGLNLALAHASNRGTQLGASQNTTGALILRRDISIVPAVLERCLEECMGVNRELVAVQINVFLGVNVQLGCNHARDTADIAVRLNGSGVLA